VERGREWRDWREWRRIEGKEWRPREGGSGGKRLSKWREEGGRREWREGSKGERVKRSCVHWGEGR